MINIKKLDKLGHGDSISLKCYINRPNLSHLQNSIFYEIDEMEVNDKYITYFFINIFISDLEKDKNTNIGFIKGCFIEPEMFMDDSNLYDVCDAESGELEKMASVLLDEDGDLKGKYVNNHDRICYISDFYIYKKYRECGIGSYILDELEDILHYYSREYITKLILLPQPRVIDNQRHTKNVSEKLINKDLLEKRLRKFYSNNGFREICNTKYMIKKIH